MKGFENKKIGRPDKTGRRGIMTFLWDLKLILGMYKPQAGGITIDGTNIQQLPPSLLRRSITYLPQEDTLFSVSIEKNIKYYSPASSEQDINAVLNSMGLLEAINSLPDKMDTQISQLRKGGDFVSLSRRLCLARSFLNKTNIVLLDEPAAGLKEEHVKLLLNALGAMKSEKTIIIASNHPALIKLADKVVTFDMGTITNRTNGFLVSVLTVRKLYSSQVFCMTPAIEP